MLTTRWTRSALAGCALAATTLAASACTGMGAGSADGRTHLIGSIYPMAWLAERIAGSQARVTTLTKAGADPHGMELTPRQIVEVGRAGLVLYIHGVQPAVDQAVEQHARDHSIDAAKVVRTLPATGDERDPHLWLDPSRMAALAKAVGDRLAEADTAHAAEYRSGAAAVAAELGRLDAEFTAGLEKCERRTLVTSHAAFGYLTDRYDLQQVAVAGIDPESEPSPGRLAELITKVRGDGTTTVFTAPNEGVQSARTLAREAGVRTATLDPVETVAAGSRADYLSIMRSNLQTLRSALECR